MLNEAEAIDDLLHLVASLGAKGAEVIVDAVPDDTPTRHRWPIES